MSREFKKTFFTSLLAVLLVISNLIGLKLTNFLDLTISVDFITYPFTFLCTLLIMNLGGKRSAYQAVLISALLQIFITISYTMAIKLGTQTMIPDLAVYVNELFKVREVNIIASLIGFLTSHYVLIYIYDNFKKYGKELYGVVIGLLGSLFLNSVIYLLITLKDYEIMFVINMLLSNIIISIIMLVIMTILFYLLKEKNVEEIFIDGMNINVSNYVNNDMNIEDVINDKNIIKKEKTIKNNKNKTIKKKSNKREYSNKNNNTYKEVKNNKTKKTQNKSKTSQNKVNKNDK